MAIPALPAAGATLLRVAVKPKVWLWVTNLVVQPAITAMFVWMALGADGVGMMVFAAVLALTTFALFVFSVKVVAVMYGKTFEIVATQTVLSVPNFITGKVDHIELATIRKAAHSETRSAATSFHALSIEYVDQGKPRSVAISSQLVGDDAFGRVRGYLEQHGVQIA